MSAALLILEAHPGARVTYLVAGRNRSAYDFTIPEVPGRLRLVSYRWSPRARPRKHILLNALVALVYRASPWRSVRKAIREWSEIIDSIVESEFVGDLFGGDSFTDLYGLSNLISFSVLRFVVLLLAKDLVLLPQTYGPFRSPVAQFVARAIVRRSRVAMARDSESLGVLGQLLGRRSRTSVRLCPDVAFAMKPTERTCGDVVGVSRRPLVGINISGLLYWRGHAQPGSRLGAGLGYPELMDRLVRYAVMDLGATVWLVPHTYSYPTPGEHEDDYSASLCALSILEPSIRRFVDLKAGAFTERQIKGIIGLCDVFVGSRMHACIAALSQGIPALGLAYSRKFRGVFDMLGMSELVFDLSGYDADLIQRTLRTIVVQGNDIREQLSIAVPRIQRQLRESIDVLLSQVGRSPARGRR